MREIRPLYIKLSVFSILAMIWGVGGSLFAQEVRGEHPGYVQDVEEERRLRVVEMVLIPRPSVDRYEALNALLFNERLSSEFQVQYDQRFGRSEAEKNIRAPSRFDEYSYYDYTSEVTLSVTEYQEKKREFGEYMVRRLSEHHVDEFFKSSPRMRPVYELKDRVSNLNMEVKKGYNVRLHYSFSGNYLDVKVENPYDIKSKLTLEMDPTAFGPSNVQDSIIYLAYPFQEYEAISQYEVDDGIVTLTGIHHLRPGLSTSLTGSTYVHDNGISQREHLILVGLTWSQ